MAVHTLYGVWEDGANWINLCDDKGQIPEGCKSKEILFDDDVWVGDGFICDAGDDDGKVSKCLNELPLRKYELYDKKVFEYLNELPLREYELYDKNVSLTGLSSWRQLFSWAYLKRFSREYFPNLDTSNVKSLNCTFRFCDYLEYVDLSGFEFTNKCWLSETFVGCRVLRYVNLSNFDFDKIQSDEPFFYSESSSTLLQLLVVQNVVGDVKDCLGSFIRNFLESRERCLSKDEFLYMVYQGNSKDSLNDLWDEGKFPEEAYIVVSPDRFDEVSNIVRGELISCLDVMKCSQEFRDQYKDCIKVLSSDSINLDKLISDVLSGKLINKDNIRLNNQILSEVAKLLSQGKSEKEIIQELSNKGGDYSVANIVSAISSYLGSSSEVVGTYSSRTIQPFIEEYLMQFSPGGVESKYTIGEVADILYKKYPENLVNAAIVTYLREQRVVR